MTKINENGQLEWTFEELDFAGAIELIEPIEQELGILVEHFNKVHRFYLDNGRHALYRESRDLSSSIYDKWEKYSVVYYYLKNLEKGRNFNDTTQFGYLRLKLKKDDK